MKFPLTVDQAQWLLIGAEMLMRLFSVVKPKDPPKLPADAPAALQYAVDMAYKYAQRKESDRHDDIEFDGLLTTLLTPRERKTIEDFVAYLSKPERRLDERFRFNVVLQKGIHGDSVVQARLKDLASKPSDEKRLESAQRGGLLQGDASPVAFVAKEVPDLFRKGWAATTLLYPGWEKQLGQDIDASGLRQTINASTTGLKGLNARLRDQIKRNLS